MEALSVSRPRTSPGWEWAFHLVRWLSLQRKAARISCSALAKGTGISEHTIRSWGRGKLPRLDHMVACANFFGHVLLPVRGRVMEPYLSPVAQFLNALAAPSPNSLLQKASSSALPANVTAQDLVCWLFLNLQVRAVAEDGVIGTGRHDRTISESELALRAGINSVQTLRNWRRGIIPSLENYIACIRALKYELIPIRAERQDYCPIRTFRRELIEASVALEARARRQSVDEYIDVSNWGFRRSVRAGARNYPYRRD
jgi:transcriptional regulator with XRE-family HTH domain